MFYKHRSSRSKLLCKNDDFKRVKMFLKVSQNWPESICVGVSFWKNRLIKKTPTKVFSCEFCKILKNDYLFWRMTNCEWLLTNLFYENKPPALKRSEMITAEIFVSFGVALHQPIFVFPSSPTFPSDLCWPIKFEIWCDRTINLCTESRNKLTFIHKKEIKLKES